jgi:hypothetical protein
LPPSDRGTGPHLQSSDQFEATGPHLQPSGTQYTTIKLIIIITI